MLDPGPLRTIKALKQNFKEVLRGISNTIKAANVLTGCEKGIQAISKEKLRV